MTATVLVYDRRGQRLAVIPRVAFGTRTWLLNDAGDCILQIPRTHPMATQANLGRMNLVTVKSDLGVPDWGGRIDSVTWNNPATIAVACKSKERILERCVVDAVQTYSGWTAGQIIREVVQRWGIDVPQNQTVLRVGSVFTGGDPLGDDIEVTGADVWKKVIPDLRNLSGHDYWVDATGAFNWAEKRGQDLSSKVILRSGRHIVRATYVLDFGSFTTRAVVWGASNAGQEIYQDPAAVGQWGMLSASINAPDDSLLSLSALATVAVNKSGAPEEKLDLRLTNRDGIFGQFWIGDTIQVVIPQYGWAEYGGVDMYLRVGGIEIDERAGTMRVIGAVDPDVTARKKKTPIAIGGGTEDDELPELTGDYETWDDGGWGEFPDGDEWSWDPDGIYVNGEDVTPEDGPTEDSCDDSPPAKSEMQQIALVTDALGNMYATWLYHVPGGNWRSYVSVSTDKGQTWSWSDTITPDATGGHPTYEISLLQGGSASWVHYGQTDAGDPTSAAGLTGYYFGSGSSGARQGASLVQASNVTVWGTLIRRACGGAAYLEQVYVTFSTTTGHVSIVWEAGEQGYKEASADIAGQLTGTVQVDFGHPGIFRPCYESGSPMATVCNVGLCYTIEIPPATNPCDGTQLDGGLAADMEDGGLVYAVGYSDVRGAIGIATYDPATDTWGDWHDIIPDVSAEDYDAGKVFLQLKSPDGGAAGYGATLYAYGTDGTKAVVYKSTDRGETWAEVGSLPAGETVTALAAVGDGSGLTSNYAFASDGKVYRQANGSGAWDAGTDIPITPVGIDVGGDLHRTIIATGGGLTAKAPEPYVEWTMLEPGGQAGAAWRTG